MANRFIFFFVLNFCFINNLVNGQNYVMPVPGDCTKYQVCDYSGCFVFNCGIGTEFNPRILVCDYPLRDRGACSSREGNIGPLIPYPGRNIDSYPSSPGTAPSNNPPGYPGAQNPGYPVQAAPSSGFPGPAVSSPGYPGLGVQSLGSGSPSPGYPMQAAPSSGFPGPVASSSGFPGLGVQNLGSGSSGFPSGSGGSGAGPNQIPYCIPR